MEILFQIPRRRSAEKLSAARSGLQESEMRPRTMGASDTVLKSRIVRNAKALKLQWNLNKQAGNITGAEATTGSAGQNFTSAGRATAGVGGTTAKVRRNLAMVRRAMAGAGRNFAGVRRATMNARPACEGLSPNSEVGDHARPGRGWTRPRVQLFCASCWRGRMKGFGAPGFPRGRGKLRPGRARSPFCFGIRV
jgi:hypothetical protein